MTPAESEIRRRIAKGGAITFAEFMELALYWQDGGYYVSQDNGSPFGVSGDYYTNPMVHPAFGALLAAQLFQMWRLLGRPEPFIVVELGCGNGQLERDIVSYSRLLPEGFGTALDYVGLDMGDDVPVIPIIGCILSNELLDSFPVHQVRVVEGALREVYVALEGEELVERLALPSTAKLQSRLDGLGIRLAEGQTAELNLGLESWAAGVGRALGKGFVLTVDYGWPAAELYSAEGRPRGALTTYYRHTQTDAPLRRVGRQDISAQVDFTSAQQAGEVAGLDTLGLVTQGWFLRSLGWERFSRKLSSQGLPARELQANRTGMLDLLRPGGLGDFKVLVQGKNVGRPRLWGLEPSREASDLVETLPPPLLTPGHLRLAEGRYGGGEVSFELDRLWGLGDGAV